LDGALSQPLLESIFDPHSAGHDGAVVIEGNVVVQFGCHLPLSRSTGGFGSLGLRHTAALGLSERSDALCVVVSEERGTISIARGEQLRKLANAAALQVELEAYYARKAPERETRPVVHWLKENPREKIIALVLSCILWIAFGYQKESVRRDFNIPLEYLNVSTDWVIEKPKIADVKIMLMGPPQAFALLNPDALKLSVDLSQIREGRNDVVLSNDMVRRPSNLTVTGITPSQLTMTASRLIEVSLPVQAVTSGSPPDGWTVQKISVSPPDVTVSIPGRSQQNSVRIRTEPIDLEKLTASTTLDARLVAPPHIQFAGGKPPVVRVTVKLKKPSGQISISPSS
jgi:YbbR domain-containing protein